MQNVKFLRNLPAPLRSVPNLGALLVGWFTVLAWALCVFGDRLVTLLHKVFPSLELGYYYLWLLPIMFSGFIVRAGIIDVFGWDTRLHQGDGSVSGFFLSICANMLLTW